jgi:hypothetical protein
MRFKGGHYSTCNSSPMNSWKSVILWALLAGAAPEVSGQVLVYEPFDYPAGQLLTGQTNAAGQGWINGGSGVDDGTIVAGGLTIPGLAAPRGNCLTNGGAGPGNRILFNTTLSSGTVYYSLALRVDTLGASFTGGTSFITSLGYQPASTLIQQAELFVRTNPAGTGGYVLGITKTDANAIVFSPTVFTNGQTLFIAVSYTFLNGGSSDDLVRLWINPDPSSFGGASPPSPTVTATVTGSDLAQIDRLNLRQNLASNIPEAMTFDELRVGTNWAEVTPPAAEVPPPFMITGGNTNLWLRWPANRRGFVLEAASNSIHPASWRTATNNVTVTGTNFTATVNPSNPAQYFRLRGAMIPGLNVEAPHYGYDATAPELTDGVRLSGGTGVNWWAMNQPQQNPESGTDIPYAYGDGYPELIGTTRTPAEAALRWFMIRNGQGDSWTGRSGSTVGRPAIILLDEITTAFKDSGQGPSLQQALRTYLSDYGGGRDDILAYAQRSVSLTPSNELYSAVAFCANDCLRFLGLELYATQEAYVTGYERDQPGVYRGTGDDYLASRFLMPVRRWTQAGVSPRRLMAIFTVSNYGDANGTTTKPYYKFLNRQFWLLANGWYTADHSVVDSNIQTVLRNGVGTYKFSSGTNMWQLFPTETNRDTYFEKYVRWYCVDGHLDAHPDGVDAQ